MVTLTVMISQDSVDGDTACHDSVRIQWMVTLPVMIQSGCSGW